MAIELGTAYISVVPETGKLAKGITGEIGQAEQSAQGQGRGIGSRLMGGVVGAAKVGAAGVAGVLGVSLVKGFGRLSAIEDAQAKLRGLGNDAGTVEQVMNDALASVKGTAFGLGDAATVAAGVVASGIKPGEDLERVLGLVGDTATIAGTSFGEMGAIFNKVSASNRLTMAEVNQLSDRGVPIMQLLADQYGVTAQEARKMVESGEVDFAAFSTAIEDNIGGAALESGETTRGAFANLGAALGRFGAGLLSGVFPKIKEVFGGLTEFIDRLAEKSQPYVERFGEVVDTVFTEITGAVRAFVSAWRDPDVTSDGLAGVFERVAIVAREAFDYFKSDVLPRLREFGSYVQTVIIPAVGRMADFLFRNRETLIPLVGAVLAGVVAFKAVVTVIRIWTTVQAALNAVMLLNPIGLVIAVVVGLIALLVVAYKRSDTFRAIVDNAWKKIREAISYAWNNIIKPVFAALSGFITGTLIPVVKRLWENTIKPAFKAIGDAIAFMWRNVVKPLFEAWWAYITNVLIPVILWLWRNVVVPAFKAIWEAVKAAWENRIKPALSALWAFIRDTLIPTINRLWNDVVKPAFQKISAAIKDAWEKKIRPALRSLRDIVRDVRERFDTARTKVINFVDKLKEIKLPGWVQTLADLIKDIADGLSGGVGKLRDFFSFGDAPAPRAGTSGASYGGGRQPKGYGGTALNRVQSVLPGNLRVTSTYRSPAHNRRVGGSPTSLHMDRNNPAVDIGGPTAALDAFARRLRAMGGWRQLLWRVKGHFDHIHVADQGGIFKGPGLVAMGPGYETFASGVGATKVADLPGGSTDRMHPDDIRAIADCMVAALRGVSIDMDGQRVAAVVSGHQSQAINNGRVGL